MNIVRNEKAEVFPERYPDEKQNIELLRRLLPTLDEQGLLAIYFRFWERHLIEDIALILGLSWDETDRLIENSIKELRLGFLAVELKKQHQAA